VHLLAAATAVGVIILTEGFDHWNLATLLVLAVFTIISDLTAVEIGSTRLKISGTFLGIVPAAVLLGGGPAALIGVLTIAIGWFRSREAGHYLRNNLITFAWAPLVGGLLFHVIRHALQIGPGDVSYYLLVFATFMLMLTLNFIGIAGYQCYLDHASLLAKSRETLAPLLSAELFSALLTMAAVLMAVKLGIVGLALFGLVLVVFQYLVGELLISKRRSEELQRMATTDELTGLANRESFRERLAREIDTAERNGHAFGVMMMDLDRFKEINDTLGHHYGDVLLRELGPRLAACVGPGGLVARFGGDEFAIIPGRPTDDPDELEELTMPLLNCVQEPFLIDELSLEVGASIGIARFPRDGRDANALLRRADVAMYAAKESHGGYKIYEPEHDHHSLQRLGVLSDFRRGLASEELVVHYQPIVNLDTLSPTGAEGLVRWQHPQLGLLPPGAFIQAVEQTGLIGPLTRYVLDRSIAQCATWRQEGKDLKVAVNLSVRNLLDRDLPREIERLLELHSLPADALQLEITESMIMSDPDRAMVTVNRLSELGVRLSIDDYGTGYSSLANLRRLPIDELKIDRSFVTPMLQDESDLIIVRSTINLAHDLGLKLVAEGVEDERTLEQLAMLGCDLVQGYHVSRPMAPDAFADWMKLSGADPDDEHSEGAVAGAGV
jgi:diguanylate cyclase (GGDEF)-like protein